LCDVLQVLVNRQLNGRPGRWRTLEAAERVPAGVRLHEHLAGPSADLLVVRRLEAGEPRVVDADITEEAGRELLVRIEAAALRQEADAVEVQRRDAARLIGRDLAAHVRELTRVAETLDDRLPIAVGAVAK